MVNVCRMYKTTQSYTTEFRCFVQRRRRDSHYGLYWNKRSKRLVTGTLTGFANIIGQKGFDNGPIDDLRNLTLGKLDQLINDAANRFKKQYKACNVRMELDTSNPALIYHHIYGTLLEKRSAVN